MTLLEAVPSVLEGLALWPNHAATIAAAIAPAFEAPVTAAAEIVQTWTPPEAPPKAPPGSGGLVAFLGATKWVALVVGTVALVFVGIMFAISKGRGDGHEIGPVLMKWLLGISIAGGASLIVSWITAAAGF